MQNFNRLIIYVLISSCFIFNSLGVKKMDTNIVYEPDVFNKIVSNLDNYAWNEHENDGCKKQPKINELIINLPTKITVKDKKNFENIINIPVCITSCITPKRQYKYYEKEYDLILYLKKLDDEDEIIEEIHPKKIIDYSNVKIKKVKMPYPKELEEERYKKIELCKKLSDEELDNDYGDINYLTINICDFINHPLTEGIYEIYATKRALESEHKKFEIIIND